MEDGDDDSSLRVVASILIIYIVAQIGALIVPTLPGNEIKNSVSKGKDGCHSNLNDDPKGNIGKKVINTKVLILGAGAAGLWAAKCFKEMGFENFMILEGAASAGGRVHDVEFAGVRVETGANWVVPVCQKMTKIVKEICLKYHTSNSKSMVAKCNQGNAIPEKRLMERRRTLTEIIEKAQNLGEKLIDQGEPDISQRKALTMNGWSPEDALDKTLEWFMCDFEFQDPPDVTSLKSTIPLENTDDNWFVTDQRGFKSIFSDIINWLKESGRLVLKKRVSVIDQSCCRKVYVTCADGSIYCADYILTTFSLGVLKHRLVDFVPALPEWKTKTIDELKMGWFTKVFIKFPRKFWGDEEWIVHVNERRGYYPTFLNLEAKGLFPPGTNILVGFIVGDEARRVEEQSSEETRFEVWSVLNKLFSSDTEGDIPMPSDILITDWSKNPLQMGSFSNWSVEFTDEMFLQVQKNVDRVFFAGEATDELYNGYIIGAMRSGERECKKLMQHVIEDMSEKKPLSANCVKRSMEVNVPNRFIECII